MGKMLELIAARMSRWPESAQEEAIASLLAIEARLRLPVPLDDETRMAVREGLDQAARGDFASEQEVERLIGRP